MGKYKYEGFIPCTLDTSLVSTDYINNPRTMNAIYSLATCSVKYSSFTVPHGIVDGV